MVAGVTKKPRKRKPRRSPPPTHLGVNLRRLREARGLSAQGLADIAGMNRVTVSNIELGKADTSLTALLQLAAALGVRPEEIIEAPQTAAPIEPQIKAFLESPYAAVTRPTKDELEWLRSRPGSWWFGINPSPSVLAKCIEMHREESRKF